MEPLLVPDDLDGNKNSLLVVDAPDNLPKTPLSKNIHNLVPVCKMVSRDNCVVSAVVVIAKVGYVRLHVSNNLVGILRPTKVDVVKVDNLAALINIQHGNADGVMRADTLLGRCTLPQSVQSPGSDFSLLPARAHLAHFLLCSRILLVQICGRVCRTAQSTYRSLWFQDPVCDS